MLDVDDNSASIFISHDGARQESPLLTMQEATETGWYAKAVDRINELEKVVQAQS